jgi:hypothetical protein
MSSADKSKRRIDEERVSVDALKHVLCTRCGCKDVHIDPVEHDPPDFTVTIDGDVFPTEVTTIVSRQNYHAQCKELAKAIHDRAASLGVLSGKYAVIVLRLPAFRSHHQALAVKSLIRLLHTLRPHNSSRFPLN